MIKSPSTDFERQIERIYKLLETDRSQVTWNDKIPDPDNPAQYRQIDITVKTGESLIHVECRTHKEPQDVKWIEELIGRRLSLHASAMIAVSSSGFTAGAIQKARSYNIHLRLLQSLEDDEIVLWKNMAIPKLVFYEFNSSEVIFSMSSFSPESSIRVTNDDHTPVQWRGLFEPLMAKFDSDADLDRHAKAFTVEMFGSLLVNGIEPDKVELSSTVRRVNVIMPVDDVLSFFDDKQDADLARVQKHLAGTMEIIQADDDVALSTDTTKIIAPPSSFFRSIWIDMQRAVDVKRWEVIITAATMQSNVKIKLSVRLIPKTSPDASDLNP